MLNIESEYIKFIKKWKNKSPNKQILIDYKKICKKLLYQKEEIVVEITKMLQTNVHLWAKKNSNIYNIS